MKRDKISNDKIIKVLRNKDGNIAKAAKALKLKSRRTLYNWINDDPELKEAIEDLIESDIDESEDQLRKARREGNMTAVIFHLKTKGKNRGYVERQEYAEHYEQPLFEEDENDD